MKLLKRRCIILTNETGKVYVKDGQVHREDGPAVECANGNKAWFLNGNQYSKEKYERAMEMKKMIIVQEQDYDSHKQQSFWRRWMGD
jgi:hypothetical protein